MLVVKDMKINSNISSVQYKNKSKVVNLIFVIYWLLIFEGTLRKWLFPEIHQYLYFVRDPFVLAVYWQVISRGKIPRSAILVATVGLGLLILCISIIKMISQEMSVQVLLFGLRNYFFYIPLSFVIAAYFDKSDLDKLIRQTLIVAIPITLLVIFQFQSPSDSFINKGVSDEGFVMQVVEGVVRTTGTFTYTAGQSFFCGSLFAMLAYVWVQPAKYRPISGLLLGLSSLSVITMISLSGSRTVFFFVALVLLGTMVVGVVSKDKAIRRRSLIAPLVIVIMGVLVFVFVFPDAFEAMLQRQESAVSEEGSTIERAFSAFYQFIPIAGDVPIFGLGVGSSSAGGSALLAGQSIVIQDDEWSRIVVENGFAVALLYILLRIWIVLKLFFDAVKTLHFSGNSLNFLLLSFVMMPLLNGSITTQGSINGGVWLFCGFCMAATNVYAKVNRTSYQPTFKY